MRGHHNTPESFWSSVKRPSPAACWLWQGTVAGKGYGQIRWNGAKVYVHRLAYELTHGTIPDGIIIRHKCDTPLCCNPAHLEPGTYLENANDRVVRGRNGNQSGELNNQAKLSASDVASIRSLYASGGYSKSDLGRMFGVRDGHIGRILRGEQW